MLPKLIKVYTCYDCEFLFIIQMGSDEQIAVDKLEEKISKLCPHRVIIEQLDKSLKDLEKVRKIVQEKSSAEIIER